MKDKKLWLAFFAGCALLFLIANRGAYKGYFQDDDLDNLSFTQAISGWDFAVPVLLPRYFVNNFRPVGHVFYYWMGATAGLNFPPYVAAIHMLHLLNFGLLWLLLGRLGVPAIGRAAGGLFFVFHMAAFDVYWKPMYVFDLLCCTFCLVSLLTYVQGYWVWSLAAFLLAYHAKEVAIMLPVVLLGYEMLLGGRRWKRLIGFFGVAVIVGAQVVLNRNRVVGDYALRFDVVSVWKCILFYASRIFLVPYAGFAVLLLWLARDRRVLFGMLAFCALLAPMIFLPGRLFSAYLYVPLIGLAVGVGALFGDKLKHVPLLLFLGWIVWNYGNMRQLRNVALADSHDRRGYVEGLADISRRQPDVRTFIYDHGPVNSYGTRGALQILHRGQAIRYATLDDAEASEYLRAAGPLAVINWDSQAHRFISLVRSQDTPDTSYIRIDSETPIWQLESGWYPRERDFRWTHPIATARLRRLADAKQFELIVNIGSEYISKLGRSHVMVLLNGERAGEAEFTRTGWQTVDWDLAPGPAGPVEVTIRTWPEFRVPQPLGSAIVAFGFLPREKN